MSSSSLTASDTIAVAVAEPFEQVGERGGGGGQEDRYGAEESGDGDGDGDNFSRSLSLFPTAAAVPILDAIRVPAEQNSTTASSYSSSSSSLPERRSGHRNNNNNDDNDDDDDNDDADDDCIIIGSDDIDGTTEETTRRAVGGAEDGFEVTAVIPIDENGGARDVAELLENEERRFALEGEEVIPLSVVRMYGPTEHDHRSAGKRGCGDDEDRRRRIRRERTLIAIPFIVFAIVAIPSFLVSMSPHDDDREWLPPTASPKSSTPLMEATDSMLAGGPCGQYDAAYVLDGDVCGGKTLEERTAYVLTRDVVCQDGRSGPILSDSTCLDCGGHWIVGGGGDAANNVFGISNSTDTTGIQIAPRISSYSIHNCGVAGFRYGVRLGEGAAGGYVSQVEAKNNYVGIEQQQQQQQRGGGGGEKEGGKTANSNFDNNNRSLVACSAFRNNHLDGVVTTDDGVVIAGCLAEHNGGNGIRLSRNASVLCTEIQFNEQHGAWIDDVGDVVDGKDPRERERRFADVISLDNGFSNVGFASGKVGRNAFHNVAACNGGMHDVSVESDDGDNVTSPQNIVIVATNLTCDNVRGIAVTLSSPSTTTATTTATTICDSPCPHESSSSRPSLPSRCSSLCPRGRGIYDPSDLRY